ncbi:MAG: molybdenum cofactor biosynthesis protein MoaE [Moraxella sp.]|nr:molybdenum cofactor biosynthesis protein MoaE [Moraxella sp.]
MSDLHHPHQGSSTIGLSTKQAYQTAITDGFALLDTPIDERILKTSLTHANCGALATFEGWVRNHNNARPVQKLTYYGYEQLALNQGKLLINQAKERFDIEQAVAIHRIGDLAIGDMAVWIGVVSAHRYPAFDACRWLLDAIKAQIPVWKQEFYTDSNTSLWLSNND